MTHSDEQQLAISSLPLRIQQSLRILSEYWGLIDAGSGAAWTELIHMDTYRIISDFAILLPEEFVAFVDEAIKRDSQHATTQDAHDHDEPKSAPIRQYLHPAWGQNQWAKAQLKQATARSLSQEHQVDIDNQSPDSAEGIRIIEDDAEEELFSRNPSPSPVKRAPTPIAVPVSPPKRRSDPYKQHLDVPHKRPRCTGSPSTESSDSANEEATEASAQDTPSKRAAAVLGSLSIASRDLDPTPPPDYVPDVDVTIEAPEVGQSWTPLPSRPESERTAFIIPRNAYQKAFDRNDVSFHVQWELERLVVRHPVIDWSDFVMADLTPLFGTSASEGIPLVHELVDKVARRKQPEESSASSTHYIIREHESRLLAEVDREERAIRSGGTEGLLSDDPSWPYGGKIAYSVTVVPLERPKTEQGIQLRDSKCTSSDVDLSATQNVPDVRRLPFKMELRQPAMTGKSFRLARRYGSRRILDIKYAEIRRSQDRNSMFDLFYGRQFLLFGRSFEAIWSASDKDAVFAVEVSSDDCHIISRTREPPMPSLAAIMDIFNPLRQKSAQAMAKWASRPQLLFSDSIPTICLSPSEIGVIEDIVVAGLDGPASTEQTLTDGCGYMTEALARRIGSRMQSPKGRPFVVQMRVGGAKGLLALMNQDQENLYPGKSVLLRNSMVKSLSMSKDPSLHIVDVLRCGGDMLRTGATLGPEPIMCLAHNGVPHHTILEMAKDGLDQIRQDFLPTPHEGETEDDARDRLIANIFRQGGVGRDREKQRCIRRGYSLRVAGLVRDWNEKCEKEAECTNEEEGESGWSNGSPSGQPDSLHESLMMAIESGFDPRQSAFACQKLHRFIQLKVDKVVTEYKVPIAQSITAFIVPDALEILAPDEIFVSFSGEGPIDESTGCTVSHLSGDVLVYRSPCKLPTDIRKLRAVYRPELCHLKDCIVMSASSALCHRSPASYLSGGDYDGDTATVIFDPALVEPFRNADEDPATTPSTFEEENFEKELVKGTAFLEQLEGADEDTMARNYQHFLLASIRGEKSTGRYSKYHEVAVYTLGYDHPETIRLARMFCLVLDSRKSGLELRAEVSKEDQRRYDGELPWKEVSKKDVIDGWNRPEPVSRPKRLGPFIMDRLYESNLKHGCLIKSSFPQERATRSLADFDALCGPFDRAQGRVDKASEALEQHRELLATIDLETDDAASPLAQLVDASRLEKQNLVEQFGRLKEHVSMCIGIWKIARCGMLAADKSVEQHYRDGLEGVKVAIRTRDPENATQTVQSRALARVWHDQLRIEDVALLCSDEHELRRLKVSCAAHSADRKDHQMFPFDVDFDTTLAMKAEHGGSARTMVKRSALSMKPVWKAAA